MPSPHSQHLERFTTTPHSQYLEWFTTTPLPIKKDDWFTTHYLVIKKDESPPNTKKNCFHPVEPLKLLEMAICYSIVLFPRTSSKWYSTYLYSKWSVSGVSLYYYFHVMEIMLNYKRKKLLKKIVVFETTKMLE